MTRKRMLLRMLDYLYRIWCRVRRRRRATGSASYRMRSPELHRGQASGTVWADLHLIFPVGPNPIMWIGAKGIGGYLLDARQPKVIWFCTPFGHGYLRWTGICDIPGSES